MNFREIKEAVKNSLDVSIKTTLQETINNLDLNHKDKEVILKHLPEFLNYITNYTSYAKEDLAFILTEDIFYLMQDNCATDKKSV